MPRALYWGRSNRTLFPLRRINMPAGSRFILDLRHRGAEVHHRIRHNQKRTIYPPFDNRLQAASMRLVWHSSEGECPTVLGETSYQGKRMA
jgi:hypothetical protein